MIKKLAILSRMYKDLGDMESHRSYEYLIKKIANKEIKEDDLQDWVQDDLAELSDMHIHNAFDKVGDDSKEHLGEFFYETDMVLGFLDNLIEQIQEGLVGDQNPQRFEEITAEILDKLERLGEPVIDSSYLKSIQNKYGPEDKDIVSEIISLIEENVIKTESSEDEDEEEHNQYQEQIDNAVTALSRLPGAPTKDEIMQAIEEKFYSEESEKDPQTHLDDIVEELWDTYSMQPDDDTVIDTSTDREAKPSSLSALERKMFEDTSNPLKNYPHFSKGFGNQEIAEAAIIQDLVKLADALDKKDLVQEADFVDSIINSIQRG